MIPLNPYFKEERNISILQDGVLGMVLWVDDVRSVPQGKGIESFQIIHGQFIDKASPIVAIRTDIRITYTGHPIKTFFSEGYALDQARKDVDIAIDRAIEIQKRLAPEGEFISASELSDYIGSKPYFLYSSVHQSDISSLLGLMDISYTNYQGRESFIINTDDYVRDMQRLYDLGFSTVLVPSKLYGEAFRFLSAPLGAYPYLLESLSLFSERYGNV